DRLGRRHHLLHCLVRIHRGEHRHYDLIGVQRQPGARAGFTLGRAPELFTRNRGAPHATRLPTWPGSLRPATAVPRPIRTAAVRSATAATAATAAAATAVRAAAVSGPIRAAATAETAVPASSC